MKFVLLAVCILGTALCAPPLMYMEFDIHHAPVEAAKAIPAGVPLETLDVLLPVDAQRRPVFRPVRGFIKQEIRQPNGKDLEMYYPFGFDLPAPVAPAAPAVPIAPVVPAALAVPAAAAAAAAAAPVEPIVSVAAPVPKANDDDDDDD